MASRSAQQALTNARPQHRLHGVGEQQNLKPAAERIAQHVDDVRIHERLAAGEADLATGHCPCSISSRMRPPRRGDIGKPIVLGARFDIAIAAVILQRLPVLIHSVRKPSSATRARRSPFAVTVGVGEFLKRRKECGVGHSDPLQPGINSAAAPWQDQAASTLREASLFASCRP